MKERSGFVLFFLAEFSAFEIFAECGFSAGKWREKMTGEKECGGVLCQKWW